MLFAIPFFLVSNSVMWLFKIFVVKDIFEFEYRWSLLLWLNALAIAGAIRGTFGEKHYTELGFEYLKRRRKYHKLCCFSRFFKDQPPRYFFVIPSAKTTYIARNDDKLPHFKVKHNYFNTFHLIGRRRLGIKNRPWKIASLAK